MTIFIVAIAAPANTNNVVLLIIECHLLRRDDANFRDPRLAYVLITLCETVKPKQGRITSSLITRWEGNTHLGLQLCDYLEPGT